MHLQPFGSFGPRGLATRRLKTGGHDLYESVSKTVVGQTSPIKKGELKFYTISRQ